MPDLIATPAIGRRRVLTGGLGLAAGLLLPVGAHAQGARLRTPAQTAGPFYPTILPADTDNDLVLLRGTAARALGTVTHLRGRVFGTDGAPVAGARLEIWQCDARGNYIHPRGEGGAGPRDSAFQGFGRTLSGADGTYSFRTIRPVSYPGRTPHIHIAIAAPGRAELVTQIYVAGEPLNARDGLYRSLGARQDAVTVTLVAANGIEEGALAGTFDIVL